MFSSYDGEKQKSKLKKLADLQEDIHCLSEELRNKDDRLARSMDVSHHQSLRLASLSAAFHDTAPGAPLASAVLLLYAQLPTIMSQGLGKTEEPSHSWFSSTLLLKLHGPVTAWGSYGW